MSEYDTIRKETQPKLLTNTKLLAVFFVQLNEAYQISVLLPIVVFMCRDFGITPQWLGVYTSILNAAFGFCQFLVSYLWGYLSDIYGRRNILMCGLFGTFVSMTIFGFSSSYIMAMIWLMHFCTFIISYSTSHYPSTVDVSLVSLMAISASLKRI